MNNPVYIYGTGTFAKDVREVLFNKGVGILGFLDHTGAVQRPEDLPETARSDTTVYIGIHNHIARIAPIVDNLRRLGYENIVTPPQLYEKYGAEMGDRYWLTSPDFYPQHATNILHTRYLFSDDTSKHIYDALRHCRYTGEYAQMPTPDTEHEYFPADLPAWPNPLRFVDCGAYTGDTLAAFLAAGYKFASVTSYEPDVDNYLKLIDFIPKNKDKIKASIAFPCGLYSSAKSLAFESGLGVSSKISEKSKTTAQFVALDESLDYVPDLIKMDIEGSEPDALEGARETIRRHAPALAISVYHAPAHLWEIPMRVAEMAEQYGINYTYYLRQHEENGFGTVFYAVPDLHD